MIKIFDRGKTLLVNKKRECTARWSQATSMPKANIKRCNIVKLVIRLMILSQLILGRSKCACNAAKEVATRVAFDTDGIPFVMDNSANCHICTEKEYFTELHVFTDSEKESIGSIGTVGEDAIPSGFRKMQVSWFNDKGREHTYVIDDAHYVPNSPVNLIGVTKFGKQIEPKEEDFPAGANIQTFTNHSILAWDGGQFKQTIIHPPSSVPTMHLNNGHGRYESLCSALNNMKDETMHKALMTEGKVPDPEMIVFLQQLRSMVGGQDMSDDLACYYYYHNMLNHISLRDMRMLAKRGKLPKRLLNIKTTPPCASCVFGKAHRRPWRRKGGDKHIRSQPGKAGEDCSMDQIVMSSPGLALQTSGKPTKRRYAGSQVSIDHAADLCHVSHLEDFTAEETIKAKKNYERKAASCGHALRKIRTDNGRFADKAFLEDSYEAGQHVEFCGVGAHHQNGISERAIRTIAENARTMLLHSRRLWPEAMSQAFWPFALSYAAYAHNHLHHDDQGRTPMEKFSRTEHSFELSNIHAFGCPVRVLDHRLQNSQKIPRWEPRCRLGIFVGNSPLHADNAALVLNPFTGLVSLQYHLAFDDEFTTLPSLRSGSIPSN